MLPPQSHSWCPAGCDFILYLSVLIPESPLYAKLLRSLPLLPFVEGIPAVNSHKHSHSLTCGKKLGPCGVHHGFPKSGKKVGEGKIPTPGIFSLVTEPW